MQLDRAKFLVLTASIAASGCPAESTVTPPITGGAQPAASTSPAGPTVSCAKLDEYVSSMLPCGEGGGFEGAHDPRRYCARFVKSFTPSAAADAVDCLMRMPRGQICGYDQCSPYACGLRALQNSKPDLDSQALCAQAEKDCPGVGEACNTFIPGMNAAARNNVARCFREKCTSDVHTCLGNPNYMANCTGE